MKKFILLFITISILLSNMNVIALTPVTYHVNIKIYDKNGIQLGLSQSVYHVETGEKSFNCDVAGMTGYGYGFNGVLDARVENKTLKISSNNPEDILFIISGDLGSYHFLIEENIPFSDLISNGTLQLTYKLSEMNELTLSTSLDGKGEGQFKYYIYKINGSKRARTDEISGGWGLFDNPSSKKVYVSDGTYNITFMNTSGTSHWVYKKNDIEVIDAKKVEAHPMKDEFNLHSLGISSIYNEYLYYSFKTYFSDNEYLEHWNSRNGSDKLELYLHKDINAARNIVSLSVKNGDIYSKSVMLGIAGEVKLTDKYHYSQINTSRHRDGTYAIDVLFEDDNGNVLRFIRMDTIDDAYLEIYDKNTNKLLYKDGISDYWDTIAFKYDESKSYLVKVYSKSDPNVNATTYFEPGFHSSGITMYEMVDIVYDTELLDLEDCSIERVYEGIKLLLPLRNSSDEMKVYNIYKNGNSKIYLKTDRVAPHYESESEIVISSEEISNYPNLSIIVERINHEIGNIFVADLLAKDVRAHWAKIPILNLLLKGFVFNRDNSEFKPNEDITRGEFSAFLSNALELNMGENPKTFSDVDINHKLYEFINKASSNGLINGYNDNTFKPDKNILRQEAAVIIDNAYRFRGIKLNNSNVCKNFADYDQIGSYALEALNMCVSNGIITGKPGNMLDPRRNLTRAEAAVIITRVLKILSEIK